MFKIKVCEELQFTHEMIRLSSLFTNGKTPSIQLPSTQHATKLAQLKEKRIVSAWIQSILAMSQRDNFMAKGLDLIFQHNATQQSVANSIGMGMSARQSHRDRMTLVYNYATILENYLIDKTEHNKFQLLLFDDDYTSGWASRFFNQSSLSLSFLKKLTVNSVDIAVGVSAVHGTSVRPPPVSTATQEYIIKAADFRGGYLKWYEKKYLCRGIDYTIGAAREAYICYQYGAQNLSEHSRTQKHATLINLANNPFKSYQDMGSSLLTPLLTPTIFEALGLGPVPSLGDFPKYWMQTALLMQIIHGEEHFIKIMKGCGILLIFLFFVL